MNKTLIAVVGPTAIGKTSWAIRLAKRYNTEIISADSRQFYREMNIGTAVPTEKELSEVRHHFIQHISVSHPWSVGDFEKAALNLLEELFDQFDIVIAVGGSGLYIKALIEGLDSFPEVPISIREELNKQLIVEGQDSLKEELRTTDPDYYAVVDLNNPHRLIRALEVFRASGKPYSSFLKKDKTKRFFKTIYLGIEAPRDIIYQRIEERIDRMMRSGLLDEAKDLMAHKDLTPLQTVGYQELFEFLAGEWDLAKAVAEIKKNTRRYAKRQLTWLRKNQDIIWVDYQENPSIVFDKINVQLSKLHDV